VFVLACWKTLCLARALFSFVLCDKQERKQRAELLEGLRSQTVRLRQLHEAEGRALQAELDERLAALQHRHREKVRRPLCLAAGRGLAARGWPGCCDSLCSRVTPVAGTLSQCRAFQALCLCQWQSSAWRVGNLCYSVFNSASLCRKENSRNRKTSLKRARRTSKPDRCSSLAR